MMDLTQTGLTPLVFEPLPPGSIKPLGWLRRQLRIQADGLGGHLDEFWPDVAESGWLGGAAEGWERGPYWLDGTVPLAYLLEDERLIAKVERWMDHVLEHQHDDGWLGPRQDQATGRYKPLDPWPVFVFLKALTQYHDATQDERVIPAMERFMRRLRTLLVERPLFDWGRMRWADLVLSIDWLYERTNDRWLLDLARKVHDQGFDWEKLFREFPYRERTAREQINMATHVVNNAMAIKAAGVWYRHTGALYHLGGVYRMIELLDAYHGQVSGVFSGDEHLAGTNPSQGTELCAVVEYMFSLEVLLTIIGDPGMGDRLERIAYNALPATFKPDMWAHQYDQQANQVICQVTEDRVYTNNAPDANIYGLAPNYGCCTANMHQGWPKFASHLWMRTPTSGSALPGLAAMAYAPCEVQTVLGDTRVVIKTETDYPFRETLRLTIDVEQPLQFPLMLRIPRWTQNASLRVGQGDAVTPKPGTFYRTEREWHSGTVVEMTLPMPVRIKERHRGSAAIIKGPLVFGLEIGEEWQQVGGEAPHADWEVLPTTPWNYAFDLDREHPERSLRFEERPVGERPFSPEGAPLVAYAQARRIEGWQIEHGAAGPVPDSPAESEEALETVRLLPYGATNLRVSEFPTLKPKGQLDTRPEEPMP